MPRSYDTLRSARWFAPDDFRSFGHRSRVMQMGYAPTDWVGKPIIAIVNTWSDANQCHSHFKQRVDDVKRGIFQAGGFPLELPAISLSESMVKPTTMLYRNFLAMETEELLRSHPIDGAVLMGGCDKTTPGLTMGALSMGLPFIYLPAGPMLRGNWRGKVLGSGSDAFKYWDQRRAGQLGDQAWQEMEAGIARSHDDRHERSAHTRTQPGGNSVLTSCWSPANQRSGAHATCWGCVASHAPHQLNVLFAMM